MMKFDALLAGINKRELHSVLVITFTADKRVSALCALCNDCVTKDYLMLAPDEESHAKSE